MQPSLPDRIRPDRRRLAFALPLIAFGLAPAPGGARAGMHRSSRSLMGTRVDLALRGADPARLAAAAQGAFAEMTRLADMMSRYRPTSALNAINLAAGLQPVPVPPELLRVLRMARQASRTSGGLFDATVGSLRDWNFSPDHPAVPAPEQLARQLRLVDSAGLVIDPRAGTAFLAQRGMRLDLGGIAKLPILQAGMDSLRRAGVADALIDGGGDVLAMGRPDGPGWRVGLRDPRQPGRLLGVLTLTQGVVAASGDYERFMVHQGRRLHHILDPRTGYPSRGLRGVALLSDRVERVNGLGTAIMVAGAAAGRARLSRTAGVDAMMVDADHRLWLSPGLSARLAPACDAGYSCPV